MNQLKFNRVIVAIAMMLIGWLPSLAHDFEVDGIFYNKTSGNTAAVTYRGNYDIDYSNEYEGNVVIPSSVYYSGITYSVTKIEFGAFYCCENLTSIEIPNSVTSFGRGAFFYCSNLASIVVDSGNTKYDSRNGCNAIIETASNTLIAGCQNTIIPNSVTSIGDDAFQSCSGLTSIEIPNSVTSIGDNAFGDCESLTSIEIPNSVTSIGIYVFSDCSNLTSIVVDAGNSIYDSRNGCNAIIETASSTLIVGCQNTIIPNSITSIGNYAFRGCSGLTSVEIPNSVTSIGRGAFYDCSSLTSIEIPNSVTCIESYAFRRCSGLTSIEIPNSVISIGEYAFEDCESLTSIQIPNSVTSIGDYAFRYCSSLTSIEIPNSVTSIGRGAFSGCSSLTSIEIPNSVTSIGNYAFNWCESLTEVTCLAATPPVIGSNTFTYYNADLYVPTGCKATYESKSYWNKFTNIIELEPELEEGATFEYEGLTYKVIVKGEELAVIASKNGEYAGDVVIPSSVDYNGITYSVTSIGDDAFNGCSSLKSIEIPNSVTSIGDYAFTWCKSLTEVTCLAATPPVIGSNTFTYYNADLYVPTGCKAAYESKSYWNKFTNIIELEPEIEEGATFEYEGLTYKVIVKGEELAVIASENGEYAGDVVIPSSVDYNGITYSVTSIGDDAFNGCSSLTSIEIPNSVTSIGDYAFNWCESLTEVTCLAATPPVIGSNTFTYYNADLYVPTGCKATYESKSYWNKFTNIIELEPELEEGATFEYEGLTYKVIVKGEELAVIASKNGEYAGDVVIPSSVNYNGVTYSVTSIGGGAFHSCSSLTSVVIGNSVTSIGEYAFYYCSSLTSVVIGNSVTSIGDGAFAICYSLTSIEIPNSVTSIGNNAFNSSRLSSIEIPNSVTSIGDDAFSGCESLTSIEIPNSVTSIGDGAFCWCTGLTSIVVDSGNTKYDSRNGCNAIIETASNTLIAGCQNTIIPNSVTIIGNWAFYGCSSLTSVQIPNSVTSIGGGAFQYCSSLTKIICRATTPPTIESDTFSNYSADLYVPEGCKSVYESAEYWKNFNIINNTLDNPITLNDCDAIIATIGNEIVVKNATVGSVVRIYSIDGALIVSEEATDGEVVVKAPVKGIYVVAIDGKSFKVMVK